MSKKRTSLGAAIVLTSPGIPMLFQGQEFMAGGAFQEDVPLAWGDQDRFPGMVQLYGDLIRLRRNWYDHTRGLRGENLNIHHRNAKDKVIAFHRWHAGGARDDVVVVLNLSTRGFPVYHLGFPQPGSWRVRFNSDWSGYDPEFGNWAPGEVHAAGSSWDGMPYSATIAIGPYSALILSQDEF